MNTMSQDRKTYTCSACGVAGHNKRKCPDLTAKDTTPAVASSSSKKNKEDQGKAAPPPPKNSKQIKVLKGTKGRSKPSSTSNSIKAEKSPNKKTPKSKKTVKKKAKVKKVISKTKKTTAAAPKKRQGRQKTLTYETKLKAYMLAEHHEEKIASLSQMLEAKQGLKGASAALRHLLEFVSDDELRKISKRRAKQTA